MIHDECKPQGNILEEYTEKFSKSSICLNLGHLWMWEYSEEAWRQLGGVTIAKIWWHLRSLNLDAFLTGPGIAVYPSWINACSFCISGLCSLAVGTGSLEMQPSSKGGFLFQSSSTLRVSVSTTWDIRTLLTNAITGMAQWDTWCLVFIFTCVFLYQCHNNKNEETIRCCLIRPATSLVFCFEWP